VLHHSDRPFQQTGYTDVTSVRDPPDFAGKVLRAVSVVGDGEADLSLEQGLSLWMRRTDLRSSMPRAWTFLQSQIPL
jgi:hypothetical protein